MQEEIYDELPNPHTRQTDLSHKKACQVIAAEFVRLAAASKTEEAYRLAERAGVSRTQIDELVKRIWEGKHADKN